MITGTVHLHDGLLWRVSELTQSLQYLVQANLQQTVSGPVKYRSSIESEKYQARTGRTLYNACYLYTTTQPHTHTHTHTHTHVYTHTSHHILLVYWGHAAGPDLGVGPVFIAAVLKQVRRLVSHQTTLGYGAAGRLVV